MNSPLKIIENNFGLPRDVLNIIQSYIVNNIAYSAISSYFNNLYAKKNLYEEFVWANYVIPRCYCNNCPDNGVRKIFRKKDCDPCFIFESTYRYMPNDFTECIIENNQFRKIQYGEKESNDYEEYEEYEEYY
jgi:hypothetical protein|tara:strand:- start:6273 stop:6668 length:396 start_codon:yes stop_codon:yes gene_type:complete